MADLLGIIARIKLDANISELNNQVRNIASRIEGITLKVNLDTNNLEGVIAQINEINARITTNNRQQVDQRIRDYQREAAERIRLHNESPTPTPTPTPRPAPTPSPIVGANYTGTSVSDMQRYAREVLGANATVTNFTSSTNNLGQRISDATVRIRTGADTFTQYRYRINETTQSIRQLSQANMDTSSNNRGFLNDMGTALEKFPVWLISGGIVMGAINAIREGITYVSEMDKAMTDLSKVVELTSSKMDEMRQSAVQLGKELGKSSVDIMQSMAEFARFNKNPEAITELARVKRMPPYIVIYK